MSTRFQIRRQGLALAVAVALGLTGNAAFAQSTVGAVYGTADAGAQVDFVNLGSGQTRSVTVGNDGKFNVSSLQPGDYKVTETTKGQPISRTITVVAGQGFNLNLVSADAASTSGAENLGAVSVTANSLPPVDVSSVQVNTVMTAEQMKSLPIARNQTAVALLTPGAVRGDGAFGNLASFSGASVAENAYYVNGFNATNFFQSLKFSQVPFEAIDQQSVQEGGYGAEYGNSTGGVVSVLTKRGTNEWKGGFDYTWNPASMQASQPTIYLKNGVLSQVNSGNKNFQLANNGAAVGASAPGGATDFTDRWSAWIGGPLIKDKLFLFAIVSDTTTNDSAYGGWFNNQGDTTATAGGGYQSTNEKQPYWLVKLDWNINESNILEYTGFSDTSKITSQVYNYGFDANNDPYRSTRLGSVYNKQGGQTNILKYTSYVTDDFTVSAQYGRSINKRVNTALAANGVAETYNGDINTAADSPGCPSITDNRQAFKDGQASPIPSCAFAGSLATPDGQDTNSQARIDFEYKLGDHDLTAGWGRTRFTSITGSSLEGGAEYFYSSMPGPGDQNPVLDHAPTADPADNVVEREVFATGAKIGLTQKYYFLQDAWHITDNFLARIGIRNDGFENQNGLGQTYV
ncbi:MAG TPA: TonB-dependent receptor, partial [Luteibacter sp.]|nr:TonB-dependent receptor [Luteibacter sp.]